MPLSLSRAYLTYLSHIILGSSIKHSGKGSIYKKKRKKLLSKRGDTKELVSNRNSIEPSCIVYHIGTYIHSILGIEDGKVSLVGWCTCVSSPFEQSSYCLSSIRATRAFSVVTHFCAHSLVARIPLIYPCVCFLRAT